VGTSDYDYIVGCQAVRGRPAAFEFDPRRGHRGLARTLANEYASDGITVNNVCPGYTRTARLDGLASSISARTGSKPEEVFAHWERKIPAGRLGTPKEFAAVVAFLASERASYVNGVSIAVDGGLVRSLL